MDYDINLDSLKQKSSSFQELNNEIIALKSSFSGSYLSTISSSDINSIINSISSSFNRLVTAFNNCEQWLQNYCQDLETLENNLANFSNQNTPTLLEFKGEFVNIFSKKTIPTLKTGGDKSTLIQTINEIATTIEGDTNQSKIYNYFSSLGFNNAAICGILANIEYESGFKSTVVGDKGTSYGICQWHNERWTRLKNYCKENNLDSTTIEGQASFLEYELKNYYPDVYDKLKNIPNTKQGAYDAAYYWTIHFERPANAKKQGQKRGSAASNKYWDTYNI